MSKQIKERLTLFKVFMSPTVVEDLTPVLHSGFITQGAKVEEFEKALQEWFGYPYILTLNSATSGLTMALRLGFSPHQSLLNSEDFEFCPQFQSGDKILCSPLTCFATICPILANGLNIIWVDTDPETANISMIDLEQKLRDHDDIKGMIFVHWAGNPLNLWEINNLRWKYHDRTNILPFLVEDCAHSFGAEYMGVKIGSHCSSYDSICVFSLQAIKHLTTGDGGLIFLPNEGLYERAKLLRWYGIDRIARTNGKDFRLEKDIPEWGYKFHMNDINATIGLSNLKYVKENLIKIRRNAKFYKENLDRVPSVKLMKETEGTLPSYWIFTIRIKNKAEFISFANKKGIMVSQVHNRNDGHSCLKRYEAPLPMLDLLSEEIICIPCGWWLELEDCQRVVDVIKKWDRNVKNKNIKISEGILRPVKDSDFEHGFLTLFKELNGINISLTYDQFINRLNNLQGALILVYEFKGRIIATGKIFVENKFYDDVGHIEDVITTKEYRGYGLGKIIVEELIKHSEALGCYKVVLECSNNVREFYEKIGFEIKGNQMVKYKK